MMRNTIYNEITPHQSETYSQEVALSDQSSQTGSSRELVVVMRGPSTTMFKPHEGFSRVIELFTEIAEVNRAKLRRAYE
jgi:hypothetical protein